MWNCKTLLEDSKNLDLTFSQLIKIKNSNDFLLVGSVYNPFVFRYYDKYSKLSIIKPIPLSDITHPKRLYAHCVVDISSYFYFNSTKNQKLTVQNFFQKFHNYELQKCKFSINFSRT